MRMSDPEPKIEELTERQRFQYEILGEVTLLTVLLTIVALQVGLTILLSQVWGIWAWILLYAFGSVPAIFTLITVLTLIQSVIMAVRSKQRLRNKQ